MKKFKLLSLLILPVITIPIVTSLSSCSLIDNMEKEINANNFNGSSKIGDLKKGSSSLHSLLYGNKSFYHGNYLMFFSVSTNATANKFLFGDFNSYTKYGNSTDFGPDHETKPFKDVYINNTANLNLGLFGPDSYRNTYPTTLDDIGIVAFIEEDIYREYGAEQNVDHPPRACTPFDKYNDRDHKVNDKHTSGSYVRNDKTAKAWRDLNKELKQLYAIGSTNESSDYFVAVEVIKGTPLTSSIATDPNQFDTVVKFTSWLNNNYKKTENWK